MEDLRQELTDLTEEAENGGCIDDPEIQGFISEANACIRNGDRTKCRKALDKLRSSINRANTQKKGKSCRK